MQLYGVLVLMLTLSTACGLRCFICSGPNRKSCTDIENCPPGSDSCSTLDFNGAYAKGCFVYSACYKPLDCCKGDLCNSAIPTGSSVLLLLVSSAIITLFL